MKTVFLYKSRCISTSVQGAKTQIIVLAAMKTIVSQICEEASCCTFQCSIPILNLRGCVMSDIFIDYLVALAIVMSVFYT